MNNKIIGIALIIIGIALALWGYDVYDSAGSQVGRALSGDTPIEAWAGMIGGVICIAIGINKWGQMKLISYIYLQEYGDNISVKRIKLDK